MRTVIGAACTWEHLRTIAGQRARQAVARVHPSVSHEARWSLGVEVTVLECILVVEVERLRHGRVLRCEQEKEDAILQIPLGRLLVLVIVFLIERQLHQLAVVVVHIRLNVPEQRVIRLGEDIVAGRLFFHRECP